MYINIGIFLLMQYFILIDYIIFHSYIHNRSECVLVCSYFSCELGESTRRVQ